MGKVIDLTNQTFGRWTVLKRREPTGRRGNDRGAYWWCLCDCGTKKLVSSGRLIRGGSQSCGCLAIEKSKKRELQDLTGRVFGRLTVLSRATNDDTRHTRWFCSCSCGQETTIRADYLKQASEPSCGCAFRIPGDVEQRRCCWCHETKPVSMFNKHKGRPAGINSMCKSCAKEQEFPRRLKRYGISKEDYLALLADQEGLCAICEEDNDRGLVIDHNHLTGVVRGLLCRQCNMALGAFQDNPLLLLRAAAYLRKVRSRG